MLHRLENEQSLARYAGWFIPLKIETKGDEWSQWATRFRHEGNGIPIVFVVRADGEQLYGKTGSLPGAELYQMIESVLARSGRILNDKQLQSIEKVLGKANDALEKGDIVTAVKQVSWLRKFGELGSLGSYAEAAVEADKLVQELLERGRIALTQVKEQLSDSETALVGAITFVDTAKEYRPLTSLTKDIHEISSYIKKTPDLRAVRKQAELLHRAKGLMRVPKRTASTLAALRKVTTEHPDSDAAKLAIRWVRKYVIEKLPALDETHRYLWTSNNGHAVKAALSSGNRDKETNAIRTVLLKKEDGKQVAVPYSRLDQISQVMAVTILDKREAEGQKSD